MKSMSKSELARSAGVSMNTLRRWLQLREEELLRMGYRREMRLLPPRIVEYICREYGISEPTPPHPLQKGF